jgi:dipeptidyl aminopeptidase/acylaminoacyl peptidase
MTCHVSLRSILLALALVAGFVVPASAQEQMKREGGLDRFLNMDAKDADTKLAVIQHELYRAELAGIVVQFTQAYGSRVRLEAVNFPSGLELIPGYVFTPVNMDRSKRHAALVVVHGGFHDRFDTYFFKFIDAAVAKGYVVIFPEYRGSSGYGESHFRNSYGDTDVTDTLASADFIAREPYVDPNRLGIVGHSRGGMVTLLAIERAPKKFKVATEIAGLVDFIAYMSYKPEYRRQEVANEPQFKGLTPDKNLPAYMRISPINFVKDIETPLLVLANSFDATVPLELHSGRLIDVLKGNNKVFESHIYKDAPGGHMFPFAETEESHDVFRRVFEWSGRYLSP